MADALSRATLARAARHLKPRGAWPFPLALMTDDARLADPVAAARVLPRGSLVILRARQAAARARLAEALRELAWRRGLFLLIADDPGLAARIGAHGIHLPERRAVEAAHWRARHADWLITVSAHDSRSILRAAQADAFFLSPVFATASHPGATGLGASRARLMARRMPGPVLALGGIDAAGARLLTGFDGLAAVAALQP